MDTGSLSAVKAKYPELDTFKRCVVDFWRLKVKDERGRPFVSPWLHYSKAKTKKRLTMREWFVVVSLYNLLLREENCPRRSA